MTVIRFMRRRRSLTSEKFATHVQSELKISNQYLRLVDHITMYTLMITFADLMPLIVDGQYVIWTMLHYFFIIYVLSGNYGILSITYVTNKVIWNSACFITAK